MKGCKSILTVASLCVILLVSASTGFAQGKQERQKGEDFIPSPVFSPPYPPLPHHFSDVYTIQVLCKAPKGAIKKALPPHMEPVGDGDTFVLLMAWTQDVEEGGYNVHEIAINAPCKWKNQVGNTTLIEYIDSDMGLIAGREVYGWPKKMAVITWSRTKTGWTIVANKMKDQGSIPLMKIDYTINKDTPEVKWPDMGPVLLLRRIPPASAETLSINQMICLGCNAPGTSVGPLEAPAGPKDSKGTATVRFFDGPHDPLTFLGPIRVLDAKMTILEGKMPFGLGLGEVLEQWEE
ncbi:MAG: acetoacetate decarboxylase family protein [Deltaproteobacteria bacterium]|nr:acetoacetate decarboxylase family protein [Deltaproteobacteria bacterium]